MLRFLAAPAACLLLCAAAAAQDMPGRATLNPPDPTQTASVGEPEHAARRRPDGDRADLGSLAPRRAEPGTSRPWCTQERRVGTGAGFCLIN